MEAGVEERKRGRNRGHGRMRGRGVALGDQEGAQVQCTRGGGPAPSSTGCLHPFLSCCEVTC